MASGGVKRAATLKKSPKLQFGCVQYAKLLKRAREVTVAPSTATKPSKKKAASPLYPLFTVLRRSRTNAAVILLFVTGLNLLAYTGEISNDNQGSGN